MGSFLWLSVAINGREKVAKKAEALLCQAKVVLSEPDAGFQEVY